MPSRPKAPSARLPANTYWRGDVIWGRCKLDRQEYRGSLSTSDPRQARRLFEEWRAGLIAELEKAATEAARVASAPERHSFMKAVVKWEAEVLDEAVKPQVKRRYMTSITCLDPHFRDMDVEDITTKTIAAYISRRKDGSLGVGKARVTNATIRRDLTALSRLLSACIAWGWISSNPAREFDRSIIRERRDPIVLPNDADVERVIAHAPKPMQPLIRLLDATGMRENEAVMLERLDIDWTARQIRLNKTKTSRPRVLSWVTPGGDAGPILEGAVPRLRVPHLFPNREGAPYAQFASNFAKAVRDAVRSAEEEGVPFRRFRAHDLRHRFAVRALQNGWSIYALSKHLGHTSVKTTEIYLDHLPAEQQDVVMGVAQKVAQ